MVTNNSNDNNIKYLRIKSRTWSSFVLLYWYVSRVEKVIGLLNRKPLTYLFWRPTPVRRIRHPSFPVLYRGARGSTISLSVLKTTLKSFTLFFTIFLSFCNLKVGYYRPNVRTFSLHQTWCISSFLFSRTLVAVVPTVRGRLNFPYCSRRITSSNSYSWLDLTKSPPTKNLIFFCYFYLFWHKLFSEGKGSEDKRDFEVKQT